MATFWDDVKRTGRHLRESVEERAGVELVRRDRMDLMEADVTSGKSASKMLDLVGFMLANRVNDSGYAQLGRMPTDMTPLARIEAAKQAQRAWTEDPAAGQQVDLYVSFALGRGVPRPQAHDDEVQDVLDACWDDEENKRVLTSYGALVERATDLAIQSTVAWTLFDDGSDGKIRLSALSFEDVQDVVRHPANKYRILYYKVLERPLVYDYDKDAYVTPEGEKGKPKTVYYEAYGAFDDDNPVMRAQDEAAGGRAALEPPKSKLRRGKVVLLAVNKTSEMAFGVPRMRRLLRWFTAYNEMLESHVNRMKAMASIYMKATAKGNQRDVDRIAQMVSGRRSSFSASAEAEGMARGPVPPGAPGVITQNDSLNFEPFKVDSGATDVASSAPQLRAQFSGPFSPAYYGQDPGALAGQQAVELPTLKFIERDQEAWEGVFVTVGEAAIQAAIDNGDLEEWRKPTDAEQAEIAAAEETGEDLRFEVNDDGLVKRDLGFDVTLPSPLKRAMGDIVGAAVQTASGVDPQGSNPEMSRWLFGTILAEAFDVRDPQRIVDQVLPRHLDGQPMDAGEVQIDPVTGEPIPPGVATVTGADGKQHPVDNPGGAPMSTTPPEKRTVREAALDDPFGDVLAAADLALETLPTGA